MSEYANLILAILLAILAFAFYRSNKALKKAKDDSENVSVSTEISQLKSSSLFAVASVPLIETSFRASRCGLIRMPVVGLPKVYAVRHKRL